MADSDSISGVDSLSSSGSTVGRSASGASRALGAYLVLQSAGRWSDVFRLSPPDEAVIGRSSSNQIAIRSERASRRHARVRWDAAATANDAPPDGTWVVEDLNSRNGTLLNGQQIETTQALSDGDIIQIAGFAITFSHQIEAVTGDSAFAEASSQATDDQMTLEMDANFITDRRRRSDHLHSPAVEESVGTLVHGIAPPAGGALRPAHSSRPSQSSRVLLQLAFRLARQGSTAEAVESVLDTLSEHVPFTTLGIYIWDPTKPPKSLADAKLADLPLVATRQSGSKSYRRPPETLVKAVVTDDGQAVLARNVAGDEQLAAENSRGEIDVESLILAPLRDSHNRLTGLVHLTTTAGDAPLDGDELEFVVAAGEILAESVTNLLDRHRLTRTLKRTRQQIATLQKQLENRVQIIGKSAAVRDISEKISLVAQTSATVLVRGESGVGKELVAAAIHHASSRRDGPWICLNCAALSPTLLESELFGHEKGAFTGATDRKRGKFEQADGGTLMLDEIGEMNAEIQAKFLRVLEGHPFERVGGHEPIRADVRVVAATNRDLQAMVREGTFRQDLYYRLNVVELIVPSLRERGRDSLLLADFFLQRFCTEMGRRIDGFTDAAKRKLLDYGWPGNIRELKNVIERAVVLNTKKTIDASDLALMPAVQGDSGKMVELNGDLPEMSLAELEQRHIERVLRHTDGNKSKASTILGVERSTLDRKLKRFAKASKSS